jgi:hypothetical protein
VGPHVPAGRGGVGEQVARAELQEHEQHAHGDHGGVDDDLDATVGSRAPPIGTGRQPDVPGLRLVPAGCDTDRTAAVPAALGAIDLRCDPHPCTVESFGVDVAEGVAPIQVELPRDLTGRDR